MATIVLSTLNARYIHSAFGLRYLQANMGELESRTEICEFTIHERPIDIAEKLLAKQPAIIGLGVYIWNTVEISQLVAILKQVSPETLIILGGPEISFETEQQQAAQLADYVICGAADLAFAELCHELLAGKRPPQKIIHPLPAKLADIRLPYYLYDAEDVAHRIIYVEASRGCPFKCEFCLSALDKTAKPYDLDLFLSEMDHLHRRGVRHFKFVDRTFNLKVEHSVRIMEFFLERMDEQLFLHFELIPDHLPERLKETIARFPHGQIQFEIGIQSFNPEVQQLISRRQDDAQTAANLRWLREQSPAHIHADLIIGLPGEDEASFAAGFDKLAALNPHEIQVGILKRLRGSPIIRHTDGFAMRYNPLPPYNILSNRDLDFATTQRMGRFARYWDMIANAGRFSHSLPLILGDQPYARFMQLSEWLMQTSGQTHKIALGRLFELVFQAMTEPLAIDTDPAIDTLWLDFQRSGLKGKPNFLPMARYKEETQPAQRQAAGGLSRQARHLP